MIKEVGGRFRCTDCGHEFSAMLGDDEVPGKCDCKTDPTGKTAIARKGLSAPARWLKEHDCLWLNGRLLDYGCGRGGDARALNADGWDPNHPFERPPHGQYDNVLCTYVLNVLPRREWVEVLLVVARWLKLGGTAFVTVRRDLEREVQPGVKGVRQRQVRLHLPKQREVADYCIYRATRNELLDEVRRLGGQA